MQDQFSSAWQPERFRQALGALRDHLGVTQAQLAEWAGVSAPQVSRWTRGISRPSYDSLKHLLTRCVSEAPQSDSALGLAARVAKAAGYPGLPLSPIDQASGDIHSQASRGEPTDGGSYVTEARTHHMSGRVWQIVRDLEADAAGVPDDVAEEMIQRAIDNAETQARLVLDAERRRWERQQEEARTRRNMN